MQMAIAASASRRAISGLGLTGNQSSGSRTLPAHRALVITSAHSDRPPGGPQSSTSARIPAVVVIGTFPPIRARRGWQPRWAGSRSRAGCGGHGHDHGQATAGSFVRFQRAAHRLGQAARHRESESDAAGRLGIAEPLEWREHPVPIGGGTPGPRSATRSSTRPPRARAVSSGGAPSGEYRSALPIRFAMTRSMSGGSAITAGSPDGRFTRTALLWDPRPASARTMISSKSAGRGNLRAADRIRGSDGGAAAVRGDRRAGYVAGLG